ncbi:uncharacterized protein LOC120290935 isoform X2 [Eucalyptus grandis]|uniref:uncharacterized protein LOC120290935 isoform X2 n=1 Tax=Eucalyptus grandis TaxID=71139 RepID=UPI00192F0FDE|nr:uncharacterized protein LOC120290935 isoform X2 [Eucalyptus grandis]
MKSPASAEEKARQANESILNRLQFSHTVAYVMRATTISSILLLSHATNSVELVWIARILGFHLQIILFQHPLRQPVMGLEAHLCKGVIAG